jgi:hypothetical protein
VASKEGRKPDKGERPVRRFTRRDAAMLTCIVAADAPFMKAITGLGQLDSTNAPLAGVAIGALVILNLAAYAFWMVSR